MSTYRWFTDSGHGWLRVPIEDVRAAGVIDKITEYSYVQYDMDRKPKPGVMLYLEEDCDAPAFIEAAGLTEQAKTWPDTYTDGESRVRRYRRWEPGRMS